MLDRPVSLTIKRLRPDTPGFARLVDESRREGFWMLVRLADGWTSGVERFRRRGEALLGATLEGRLTGLCGLIADPYFPGPGQGRVRCLYVSAPWRGRGVGMALAEAAIEKARGHFTVLNVRAPPQAFAFYESIGFLPVPGAQFLTHRMVLSKTVPAGI